jgi:hypothetical protein
MLNHVGAIYNRTLRNTAGIASTLYKAFENLIALPDLPKALTLWSAWFIKPYISQLRQENHMIYKVERFPKVYKQRM